MNCRRERIKSMKLSLMLAAVSSLPGKTIRVELYVYIIYFSYIFMSQYLF